MKKWYCLLIVVVFSPSNRGLRAAPEAKSEKPMNVIFILVDDLGWSDVTLNGKTSYYETPNLDRLAMRGLTFNRAYAASPVGSPTRASILTGQTPGSYRDNQGCLPRKACFPRAFRQGKGATI